MSENTFVTQADTTFTTLMNRMRDDGVGQDTLVMAAGMVGQIMAEEWARGLRAGLNKESE